MQPYALHKAVIQRNLVEIQRLINEGVDIDERDKRGFPALHYAVHFRDTEAITLLLQNGTISCSFVFSTPYFPVCLFHNVFHNVFHHFSLMVFFLNFI
jgi:ankyrin repeat protein